MAPEADEPRADERGPRRTCVACREGDDPDALIRIVRDPEGRALVDLRRRMPGRGAWVHAACLERVEAKPAMLQRPLKGPVQASGLKDQLREQLIASIGDGLSIGAAAGALIGGNELLTSALERRGVLVVVVASDASERTIDGLKRVADPSVPFVTVPFDRDKLGARVGRGARAALGVQSGRATSHLVAQLRRLRSLG